MSEKRHYPGANTRRANLVIHEDLLRTGLVLSNLSPDAIFHHAKGRRDDSLHATGEHESSSNRSF